jgi:hypothetical protein
MCDLVRFDRMRGMAYEQSRTVGRVAFLARLEMIREMLVKGHRNKEIFAKIEVHLNISYSQFNRYIIRYITAPKDDARQMAYIAHRVLATPSKHTTVAELCHAGDSGASIKKTSQKRHGFYHDPSSDNFDGII